MTKKQRMIMETEEQIRVLQLKLKVLESLPNIDLDDKLCDIFGFPIKSASTARALNQSIGSVMENHKRYATLEDLLKCSKKRLLEIYLIGPHKVDLILKWMKENNLHFFFFFLK